MECRNGQAIVWEHAPIPCEYWEGECPWHVELTCQDGCGIEAIYDPWVDPRQVCAESQPGGIGDACTSDADCRAPLTEERAGDVVRVYYVGCDEAVGRCVEVAPPVLPGYLGPCDLEPGHNRIGFAEAPACPGGLCLVAWDVENGCEQQGCTAACEVDQQCPEGSRCVHGKRDWTPGSDWTPGTPGGTAVCRKGPLDKVLTDHRVDRGLTCP